MSNVVLIDGHHMMYRAYFAIPRTLKTKEGEQINITFGMASMLINILQAEQPDEILVCFDAGSETFRHTEHAEYKAGRAETPDDFYPQLPRVLQYVTTLGLPMFSDPRYEADDLLAMYAVAAAKRGDMVTIVSGDRDLFQLASDHIRIAIPHKGYQAVEYLRQSEVEAKLGVTPTQVACFKGLAGDSSDNLAGVPGIGPKTAAMLLQTWGSLEGIYENIEKITGSVQQKLEQNKEQAFFCKKLATLLINEPLPLPIDSLRVSKFDLTPVFELSQQLQFTMLLRRLINLTKSDKFTLQEVYKNQPFLQKSEKNTVQDQLSLF
jgi:DNA polymerase I